MDPRRHAARRAGHAARRPAHRASPSPLRRAFLAPLVLAAVAWLPLPVQPVAADVPAKSAQGPAQHVKTRTQTSQPVGQRDAPIGGELLGGSGVVVHAEKGVRKLPTVNARSYVVADAETGEVLAAKDPHGRYRPASTLKVLTAITLLPVLEPDEKILPDRKALAVEGSKVGVTNDMRYRVDDLFRGLLLTSGNDAALTLTQAAGGLEHALSLMNAKADELRAEDTVAKTPHGLDRPGQLSSAYDLALFARAGLGMPDFRDYTGTERARFPAPDGGSFQIANHNDLLTEYKGCIGGKTGYTSKARAAYIGMAKRHGHTIIITLMHTQPDYWDDARSLLDWGFAAAGKVEPVGRLVEPEPPPPSESPDAGGSASIRGESSVPRGGNAEAVTAVHKASLLDKIMVLTATFLSAVIVVASGIYLLGRRPARRYQGRRRRLGG